MMGNETDNKEIEMEGFDGYRLVYDDDQTRIYKKIVRNDPPFTHRDLMDAGVIPSYCPTDSIPDWKIADSVILTDAFNNVHAGKFQAGVFTKKTTLMDRIKSIRKEKVYPETWAKTIMKLSETILQMEQTGGVSRILIETSSDYIDDILMEWADGEGMTAKKTRMGTGGMYSGVGISWGNRDVIMPGLADVLIGDDGALVILRNVL